MNKNQQEILKELKSIYGQVGTALRFHNPFELLVATTLSAQSTDKQVNKVTAELFKKYPTVYDMAALTAEELAEEIKSIGLYKNKSKHIVAACKQLIEKHNGVVPEGLEELMDLPGVGRKTANVVRSNAFGIPALAVDTHVFRVSRRLKLSKGKDVLAVEKELMKLIPKEDWSQAHHWLIWHGRIYCKAKNPQCAKCKLAHLCPEL